MPEPTYVSQVRIERRGGPVREAFLPGEDGPIVYGVHGAIADHYGVDPDRFPPRATTIDHVIAAAAG